MPNEAQEKLFEIFVQVAGEQVSSLTSMVSTSQQLAGSLTEVVRQINITKSTALPPAASATTAGSDDDGIGASARGIVEGVVSRVFQNALGAVPLVRGILGLFGGGDEKPAETPLLKYVLPPSISFQAAKTEAGFSTVDFDQMGQARAFDGGAMESGRVPPGATQAGMPVAATAQAGQQITVNVQAMDARSFLDRSSDIAAAVRNAMLNLNSINDVVNDL
jgi:hypothetical protein